MSNSINRRKFFCKAGGTLVAGGAVAYGSGVAEARSKKRSAPVNGVDYYAKLGVTPFINAAGTFTFLSASILPEEVQAAMTLAAQQPVNIEELHKAAGEYLAKQLKCEAALVTAGAASALTLGTAACVSMGNAQSIVNLPTDMTGLKNEVIVQKTHRYDYDHALRNCGIKFVNVETLADYEAAFNREHRDGPLLQRCRKRPDQPRRLGAGGPQAQCAVLQRCRRRRAAHLQSLELHPDGI